MQVGKRKRNSVTRSSGDSTGYWPVFLSLCVLQPPGDTSSLVEQEVFIDNVTVRPVEETV